MTPELTQNIIFFILYIWSIICKGIALWRAAHYKQRNWFVFMLILNTFGLLELVYLLRFSKKKLTLTEIQSWKEVFVKKVKAPEKLKN